MKLSIIGIGRLGGALALALAGKGFQVENLIARNHENAAKIAGLINPQPRILSSGELEAINSETIFIAVQDFAIQKTAENLALNLKNKPTVFHTSGSLSSEILQSLRKIGCPVGSFHPLVSVSDAVLGKMRFNNSYFCVEGDAKAVEAGKEIVGKLGGNFFSVETRFKTLYHASAVMASGHLTALVDSAIETLQKCGLDERRAQEILLPLIASAVENLKLQTPVEALTGTFARADVETLEKHIETLRENISGDVLETYLQLGERSVRLAERQGADKENLEKMREKILLAKKNFRC